MKKFLVFLLSILCTITPGNALKYSCKEKTCYKEAGDIAAKNEFRELWGAGDDLITRDTYKCVGTSADAGLDKFTSISGGDVMGQMRRALRGNYLEHNAMYYVAHEINDNGAKLCKTIVTGGRGGCGGNAYTSYYYPSGSEDCFWVCKSPYYGEGCTTTEIPTKDAAVGTEVYYKKKGLNAVTKLAVNGKKATNIEDNIPMFFANHYIQCSHHNKNDKVAKTDLSSRNDQEHDVILALYYTDVSDDGRMNMVVNPLAVRAGTTEMCAEIGNDIALPMVKFVGGGRAVCPSDYSRVSGYVYKGGEGCSRTNGEVVEKKDESRISDNKLDGCTVEARQLCVQKYDANAVNAEKQAELLKAKLGHMCSDYNADLYKEDVHDLLLVNSTTFEKITEDEITVDNYSTYKWDGKCTMYKCRSSVLGFKSDWKTSGDVGCYECTGETMRFGIDKKGVCQQCPTGEAFSTGQQGCVSAEKVSKNDMRFGVGNTPSTQLSDQCWVQDTPACYKYCITGDEAAKAECDKQKQATQ